VTRAPRKEPGRIVAALREAATRLEQGGNGATADGAVLTALVRALEDAIAGPATETGEGAADPSPATAPRAPVTHGRLVHDLRSTSGTLLTWCYLMRRGGISQEQLAHGATVMERAVRRQLQLVEQLVAAGRRARAAAGAAPTSSPQPVAGAEGESRKVDTTTDLHGVRILIVDDDADARDAMRMMLTARGADVSTAVSAIDAFDVLQQGRPDVLISDIVMPDADGYALLRRVRAPDTGDRGLIPAIAVTGRGRQADRQHALAAGYQCQLTKPIAPDELIAAVQSLLAR